MLSLWANTLLDLTRSVVEEHLQRETGMNKERFIRISSWALILGAISLTLGTIAYYWRSLDHLWGQVYHPSSFPTTAPPESTTNLAMLGPLLLAIGMLGLLYRYGDEVGRLGTGALAIGAIGCFLVASGASHTIELFWEVLGDVGITLYEGPRSRAGLNGFGVLYLSGLGVLYLSLVVFGVTALTRKPLPRWNWLPILAGIVPLMITADTVLALTHGDGSHLFPHLGGVEKSLALAVSISAVILGLLGYVLKTDTHRDSAIA